MEYNDNLVLKTVPFKIYLIVTISNTTKCIAFTGLPSNGLLM